MTVRVGKFDSTELGTIGETRYVVCLFIEGGG